MAKIHDELIANRKVSNNKLLDYIIALQLGKIERYDNGSTRILDSNSEIAMQNLIELLKLRQNNNK